MSRKKKIFICGVCIVVLCIIGIIVGLLGKYCIDLKEKKEQEEEHKRLMEESIQEIEYINENSNFVDIELMGPPLEDFDRHSPGFFKNAEHYVIGGYYCENFNGKYCVTEIAIYGDGTNLLGIALGDSYDEAAEMMDDRGYTFEGQSEERLIPGNREGKENYYIYEKAYMRIVFAVSEENIIRAALVHIWDPYYPLYTVKE